MRELSVFIDESGDFGPLAPHSPYYLIALVFHDQSRDISEPLGALRKHAAEAGYTAYHAVHSAPLIRREGDYRSIDMTARRKLFRALYNFTRQCDIRYRTFLFRKSEFIDRDAIGTSRALDRDKIVSRTSREIGTKTKTCGLSNSEAEFFHSVRDLKKNYLKPLARKRLD